MTLRAPQSGQMNDEFVGMCILPDYFLLCGRGEKKIRSNLLGNHPHADQPQFVQ
jgi:hypothetical protein